MTDLTDFIAEQRHYCRNPRCRSKLPAPVANAREAFCTRGCHSGFYRTRCLVCEAKMERRTENQLICGKRRCRNALQARQSLGRYHASSAVIDPLKTSIKPGVKSGVATDRPWRIVAGEELTAEQLHCVCPHVASHHPGPSQNRKPCTGPMLLRPLTDFIELCLAHRIRVDDVDNFPQVSAATAETSPVFFRGIFSIFTRYCLQVASSL
jgi:hypothetical protein